MRNLYLHALRILTVAFVATSRAPAADVSWINPAGGNWSNPTNWSSAALPSPTDQVFITLSGSFTVTQDVHVTVASLTLGDGLGTPVLTNAVATLSLSGPSVVRSHAVFSLAGGTLAGSGPLQVDGAFLWTSGAINDSAQVAVGQDGQLEITGASAKMLGGVLSNAGVVRMTGAGALGLCRGTVDNLAGGVFELENDQPLYRGDYCGPALFRNAGLLRKSAGAGTNRFAAVPVDNSGTVEVQGGWIAYAPGSVFRTGTQFLGAGTNLLDNGAVWMDGTIVSGNAVLAGATLYGTNTIRGAMKWTSGDIGTEAQVTVEEAGQLEITGAGVKLLWGALNNAGLVRMTGAGALGLCRGTVENLAGAVFELENDQPLYLGGFCGPSLFRNAGLLVKSGGGGTNLFYAVPVDNSGIVEVQSGWIAYAPNSAFRTGTQFLGAGTNLLNNGAVWMDGTILSDNAELAGATLYGTNTVQGLLKWTGGGIDANARVTIDGGAQLEITGASAKMLGGVLSNAGVVRMTGAGALGLCRGTVDNLAGGVFELENDQPLYRGDYCGSALFRNAGLLRKSAGGGTNRFLSMAVENTGTVKLQAGQVSFEGGFTQTAGRTHLNGGSVASLSPLEFKGGIVSGTGDVFAEVHNRGEINPGASFGALTIHGPCVQSGTLNIELGGLIPGTTHDRLEVTGLATLGGALNVCLAPGYRPQEGDAFPVVTFGSRSGSFAGLGGLNLGGGKYLTPVYTPTNFTLLTTNGPTNLFEMVLVRCGEGQFQVRFTGEPGELYEIQASFYLTNDWVTLWTTNSPVGVIDFIDADAPLYPQRFYRAWGPP
jgi:hypothetical protein